MGLFKNRKNQKRAEELLLGAVCDTAVGTPYRIHFLFEQQPQMPAMDNLKTVFAEVVQQEVSVEDALENLIPDQEHFSKARIISLKEEAFLMKRKIYYYQYALSDSLTIAGEDLAVQPLVQERTGVACTYEVVLCDLYAYALEAKQRGDFLMDGIEAVVRLFPECVAVWNEISGKIITAEEIQQTAANKEDRYANWAVGTRSVQDEDGDIILDTLGMAAIGYPDIQYYFNGMTEAEVTNHALNLASYMYGNDSLIKDGDVVDGLKDGHISQEVRWMCQYEESRLEPKRMVLNVYTAEYVIPGLGLYQ